MPHYHFCTLFDRNYLFKGVALHRSLLHHCQDFTMHMLCMDDITFETVAALDLPRVKPIRLAEFEDPELLSAKRSRSAVEYFWTCTPSLPLFVLEREPAADLVTYLDADLFFYGPPDPIFEEMGSASILAHEHRFPPHLESSLKANGLFNVGFVSFRRDDIGFACVREWRGQCNEWCYYREEDGKMGDQKYLDAWPAKYGKAFHVLQHKGGGAAPWNISRYRVARRADGRVYLDDDPLVFYHFHSLRLYEDGSFKRANAMYQLRDEDIGLIYDPYLAEIAATRGDVEHVAPGFRHGLEPVAGPAPEWAAQPLLSLYRRGLQKLKRGARRLRSWFADNG